MLTKTRLSSLFVVFASVLVWVTSCFTAKAAEGYDLKEFASNRNEVPGNDPTGVK